VFFLNTVHNYIYSSAVPGCMTDGDHLRVLFRSQQPKTWSQYDMMWYDSLNIHWKSWVWLLNPAHVCNQTQNKKKHKTHNDVCNWSTITLINTQLSAFWHFI